MRIQSRIMVVFMLGMTFLMPAIVLAHQPRITTSTTTVITDPEISKAYYGQLDGIPHTYEIHADHHSTSMSAFWSLIYNLQKKIYSQKYSKAMKKSQHSGAPALRGNHISRRLDKAIISTVGNTKRAPKRECIQSPFQILSIWANIHSQSER